LVDDAQLIILENVRRGTTIVYPTMDPKHKKQLKPDPRGRVAFVR